MFGAFRLGDADTVQTLLESAGFSGVRIRREKKLARFPSSERFTHWLIVGSVLGRSGIRIRDESLAAIAEDVDEALRPYVTAAGLAFPMEAHLAIANR